MKTEVKLIKCVIIDDEIEACDRLQSLLEKIPNVSVITAETKVETGIKKVIALSPDIVFLDVEMPKENGFEVVKEIRAKNVFPTFIFVSGYNQYAIKAIRSAAFDYLLKPVDIDELNETVVRYCNAQKEKLEIMRRYDLYRRGKPPLNLRNKVAIVTDDGIATGATMQAAILEIKLQKPAKIILAVPVAPPESIDTLKAAVDEVVCLETSEPFFAIGNFYQNFQQTEDKEVIEILS